MNIVDIIINFIADIGKIIMILLIANTDDNNIIFASDTFFTFCVLIAGPLLAEEPLFKKLSALFIMFFQDACVCCVENIAISIVNINITIKNFLTFINGSFLITLYIILYFNI